MTTVKIFLYNILNNWDKDAFDEFDFDYNDKAFLGKVNEFDIEIKDTDNYETLVQKISLYLFDLLVNDKENWKNKKRCRFCYKNTVELDEKEEYIECSTCKRIYKYAKNLENIPFPHPKYIYIKNKEESVLYSNNSILQTPLEFLNNIRYDKLNLLNSYFDRVSDIIKHSDEIQISSLLDQKPTLATYDCIIFNDFYEFLEKTDVLVNIKETYTKLFWYKVNYSDFQEKIKNSKTNDNPNFIQDNNSFKLLENEIKSRDKLISEFEKLEMSIFTKITKAFSSVIIKTMFDKEPFLNLLNIFQTIELSSKIPYVSLYVDEISQMKHKIWRPLAGSDLQKKWDNKILHKKSLKFKIKYNSMYFTCNIYNDNNISIVLPISNTTNIEADTIIEIIKIVNQLIKQIKLLPYQQKLSKNVFQEMDSDILKIGTKDSNVIFSALNMNNVIEQENIDMDRMGILLECLKNYVIVDKINENKVSFFYVYDVEDKQSIRYEKFLRNAIQKKMFQFTNNIIENNDILENIKVEFGEFFNLEENHQNFLFNKWITDNNISISNIKEAFKYNKFKWSILSGIYITIEYTDNNIFKFRINGIKQWKQENKIIDFVRRLFYLIENLENYPFFKNICKINGKKITTKTTKDKNLKQALKKYFPNLFWDSSENTKKGYARKCQKKEQPLIFSTEQAYNNWFQSQQPQNKTNLQKIFTRGCPDFTKDEMVKRIKELGHIPNDDNICIQFQLVEYQNKDKLDREGNSWTLKELKEMSESLNLPILNSREKLLANIDRYFTIEEFKIKENIEDVMPNPSTFVINQDDNKFYITCPNGLNNSKSKNSKFMGFLDIDEHPSANTAIGNEKRKFCVPCCKERINESRTDFCSGLLDYEDYIAGLTSQGNVDYIKNHNKFPLTPERYGHLHPKLFQLLNRHPKNEDKLLKIVNRLSLIKPNGLFLRLGIPQNNFSFINAIITAINMQGENISFQQALKSIKNSITENVFRNLNSGNLYWKYNGIINDYKKIFDTDNLNNIDIHDIWDIISREKILTLNGLNIIIFEIKNKILGTKEVEELHLVCPQDQEINHFFQINKPTVFLFKGENNQYEPIINYFSSEKISLFDFSKDNMNTLESWYKETCTLINIDSSMTAKSLIKEYDINTQFVDSFNKVQYLLTVDNFIIPTIPSGFSLNIPIESSIHIKKYVNKFEDTLDFLKDNNFEPKSVIVNNDNIIGIVVKSDRIVPVIFEQYKQQLPKEEDLTILDFENVDQAILSDLPKLEFQKVNKQLFREEAYQRFRLEFSHYISIKNIKKDEIQESFDNVIKNFTKDVVEIVNLNFDLYEIKNIRTLCQNVDDSDKHCNNNKLIILKKDIIPFQEKLRNELEKFPIKAQEIYTKRIDTIIDPLLFLNDLNNVFF